MTGGAGVTGLVRRVLPDMTAGGLLFVAVAAVGLLYVWGGGRRSLRAAVHFAAH